MIIFKTIINLQRKVDINMETKKIKKNNVRMKKKIVIKIQNNNLYFSTATSSGGGGTCNGAMLECNYCFFLKDQMQLLLKSS